ncbi:hypothetical protein CHS0354_013783, partial [Potamilus streckersoni]
MTKSDIHVYADGADRRSEAAEINLNLSAIIYISPKVSKINFNHYEKTIKETAMVIEHFRNAMRCYVVEMYEGFEDKDKNIGKIHDDVGKGNRKNAMGTTTQSILKNPIHANYSKLLNRRELVLK